MSKSVESTRRELFEEKAFCQRYISSITRVNDDQFGLQSFDCPTKAEFIIKDDDGNYIEDSLNFAWWGFNKALDAVEIELPHQDISHYGGPDSEYGPSYEQVEGAGYNHGLSDCKLAIEATNLGLKIK